MTDLITRLRRLGPGHTVQMMKLSRADFAEIERLIVDAEKYQRSQTYEPKNLFAPGQIVRHRSGNTYKILFRCTIERDLSDCYAYRSTEGQVWIRPAIEMEDGRFTLVQDGEA